MTADDLEGILASDDTLEPSSGFAASVMGAVRGEAVERPSIPFPWWRFALGVAACVALAGGGSLWLAQAGPVLRAAAARFAPLAPAGPALGYAALAVILSLVLSRLPRILSR
jgi:hypothetical protein